MKSFPLIVAMAFATFAKTTAVADNMRVAIACPAEIPAESVQVVRPTPGWTGFVPSRFLLHSVGVTLGPLDERATQRGDFQQLAHKAYRVSYSLQDWKGEKWLTCEYASGQIVQAQLLPADVSACDVLYTPDKHGVFAIQTTCKLGEQRR